MILSVPLVAVTRIIMADIDHPWAEFVARILEGRLFDKYSHLDDPLASIIDEEFGDLTIDSPVSETSSLSRNSSLHELSVVEQDTHPATFNKLSFTPVQSPRKMPKL